MFSVIQLEYITLSGPAGPAGPVSPFLQLGIMKIQVLRVAKKKITFRFLTAFTFLKVNMSISFGYVAVRRMVAGYWVISLLSFHCHKCMQA